MEILPYNYNITEGDISHPSGYITPKVYHKFRKEFISLHYKVMLIQSLHRDAVPLPFTREAFGQTKPKKHKKKFPLPFAVKGNFTFQNIYISKSSIISFPSISLIETLITSVLDVGTFLPTKSALMGSSLCPLSTIAAS